MSIHKHTNKLVNETSPYLLQHAYNPVDWYPWGDEAWQKAKSEDKPVLVSIGYAACHWCHVMERESFEDEETAKLMNENFINIKIDREERPDLDNIYMEALQVMAGQGGWPLHIFLTPEKKPFFGGTYFPPKRLHNRMSWQEILIAIRNAYYANKEGLLEEAEKITTYLQQINTVNSETETVSLFTKQHLQEITEKLLEQADKTAGGFGKAPKFPQTFSLLYLLRYAFFEKDTAARDQVLLSLDKMMRGGIYDQIGGGFSRYSTDAYWLAPHFEKMLYDNALLLLVYTEAYQFTNDIRYKELIIETITFLEREMKHPNGGYFSALDADSEGREGKFYVWQQPAIEAVLKEDAPLFCDVYDVTEKGNWESENILWLPETFEAKAHKLAMETEVLQQRMKQCREKLFAEREKRIRPATDTKILTGWNALLIAALARAGMALQDTQIKERAITSMTYLEANGRDLKGEWLHAIASQTGQPAFLDDLAAIIKAYIVLQEMTGDSAYLKKAKELTLYVMEHFSDEQACFFYFTSDTQSDVLYRKIELYDGATPSGNAMMGENLYYLSFIYDNTSWCDRSIRMLTTVGKQVIKYPLHFGIWVLQLQAIVQGIPEIVITGQEAKRLLNEVMVFYIPSKIVQAALSPEEGYPMLKEKIFDKKNATIYLCRNYACEKPVLTAAELFLLLKY